MTSPDHAVLDILLYVLPLDALEDGFWSHLSLEERCLLKATSRQGRRLADLLTTAAVHKVWRYNQGWPRPQSNKKQRVGSRLAVISDGSSSNSSGDNPGESSDNGGGDSTDPVPGDSGTDSGEDSSIEPSRRGGGPPSGGAWEQALQRRCAWLSRLPRLKVLTLCRWNSDADLQQVLGRFGAATSGRVTSLTLVRPLYGEARAAGFSLPAASAILGACPNLSSLTFDGESLECGCEDEMAVRGPVFTPLQGLTQLTELEVRYYCKYSDAALVSLGSLSHLQHLDIAIDRRLKPQTLQPLAGLGNLNFCRIQMPQWPGQHPQPRHVTHPTVAEVAPLLLLTRLSHLHLYSVFHSAQHGPIQGAAEAMARLGALESLVSLRLGRGFVVDNAAFDALQRLTALTALEVGHFHLASPVGPNHLPRLCRLGLNIAHGLPPSRVLHTLRPLLPLPALTHVGEFVCGGGTPRSSLHLLSAVPPGSDVASEAQALRSVAQHLAAAPCLVLQHLTVSVGSYSYDSYGVTFDRWSPQLQLTREQVVEALQPLAGCLLAAHVQLCI